jgi:hypothetical protein
VARRKNTENKRQRIAELIRQHGPLTARGIANQWSKSFMGNTNKFRRNVPTVNSLSNLLRNKRFVVVGQVAGGTSLFRDKNIRTGSSSALVNVYGLRQDEEE